MKSNPSVIRTRGKAYIEWNVALTFVFENGIPSDDHVINPETEQFPMLQLVTTKITSQSWRKPWIVIYNQGGCQRLLKMTCFLPRGKRTNRAVEPSELIKIKTNLLGTSENFSLLKSAFRAGLYTFLRYVTTGEISIFIHVYRKITKEVGPDKHCNVNRKNIRVWIVESQDVTGS